MASALLLLAGFVFFFLHFFCIFFAFFLVLISVQVLDENCDPIPQAEIDLWQTDAAGHYGSLHPGEADGYVSTIPRSALSACFFTGAGTVAAS
jgi:hypothetical protein